MLINSIRQVWQYSNGQNTLKVSNGTTNAVYAGNGKMYWVYPLTTINYLDNSNQQTVLYQDANPISGVKITPQNYSCYSSASLHFSNYNQSVDCPLNSGLYQNDILDNDRIIYNFAAQTGFGSLIYTNSIQNQQPLLIAGNDSTYSTYKVNKKNLVVVEGVDNDYVSFVLKYKNIDSLNLVPIITGGPLSYYADNDKVAINDCNAYILAKESLNGPFVVWKYDYYGVATQLAVLDTAINYVGQVEAGNNYLYYTAYNNSGAGYDVYRLPINACNPTGIAENTTDKPLIELYPNPANSNVTIKLPLNTKGTITLTDLAGRIIFTESIKGLQSYTLPVNTLAKGMYIVSYQTALGVSTQKLIVQ
jgi:hypothetical protein